MGISFNATTVAVPIVVELIETGTVFATVTAHVEAGVSKVDDSTALAATLMTLSTTGTGYTASAEGSIVAVRESGWATVHVDAFAALRENVPFRARTGH